MNRARLFRAALIATILFFGLKSNGQNWQTIHSGDTQFFCAPGHKDRGAYPNWYQNEHPAKLTGALRSISVNQVSSIGTDSVFFFSTTWRDTTGGKSSYQSNCFDTAAPSWIGRQCIHHQNGEEWYFDRDNDTISVHTLAGIGDSWIFYHDRSMLNFRATVIAADTFTWSGIRDSFKTASIQAYNGSVPVYSYVNKMVLQWSKNLGWVRAIDFYAFPYCDANWEYGGDFVDSSQHVRLPAAFRAINLNTDIFVRYQPGNECIRKSWNASVYYNPSLTVDYDSVISVTVLSQNQISVQSLQRHYTIAYNATTGSYSTSTVNYVVNAPTPFYLKDYYFYDRLMHQTVKSPITQRLFVDTQDLCGNYFVSTTNITPCSRLPEFNASAGCIKIGCNDGVQFSQSRYLSNFGQVHYYYCYNDLASVYTYNEWYYPYIKLNGCTYGTKFDVSKLSIPQVLLIDFKSYPNPANSTLTLELPYANGLVDASLCNALGQRVLGEQFDGTVTTMNVASVPAGLYWLEIRNQQGRAVKKIVVAH